MQEQSFRGKRSLTNQFNLPEDFSIHISLRKAYLKCGTRVVGKVFRDMLTIQ